MNVLRFSKLSGKTKFKFFQEKFEQISLHCHRFAELIPVTFVLGFYVSIVITRFRCTCKHVINNWTTYNWLAKFAFVNLGSLQMQIQIHNIITNLPGGGVNTKSFPGRIHAAYLFQLIYKATTKGEA